MQRVAVAAVTGVVTAGSLAVGCTAEDGPHDDGRAPEPTAPPSPSRGARGAGPVLAVKVDNAPGARPHTGLGAADIVYVEQVEGGLSRLMAVYATRVPEAVGPVRSARETDLELLRQFDRPVLAFSGAQTRLLPLVDRAPLRAEPPARSPGAYYRAGDRAVPHNLYLRPLDLLLSAPGKDALTTGFTYGAAPEEGRTETTRTVRYPAARFTFTWDGSRGSYRVAMDGTPAVTTEGRALAPATVVVQYVRVRRSGYFDSRGSNTPYSETVGSGTAKVLRDGKTYDALWKRPEAGDGTRFTTADGEPVNFADGQVWVVLARATDQS
ncbi:DUF3048 domain-containing protein [Streptomyces chromofuscus]|uniref:DUF3048 domain-containing protein n=1 Tax=Streptomyces chromofuscus TaxID=42881 RepID=A0A7M2T7M4_STRCW|nr:DUF3048 domain-containing protein [Streptomyces chromofuscus]QOV44119.1 DUF3048 domain-containing protein [Streptomyces chromofuscus]GGT05536.1 hypothetical protein GCM10010254_27290 [Streptomyces chromofuscus]